MEFLQETIKSILNAKEIEMHLNEDINCCRKINPIHKIEAIKIIYQSGEVIAHFKQFDNHYHLCLKYSGD